MRSRALKACGAAVVAVALVVPAVGAAAAAIPAGAFADAYGVSVDVTLLAGAISSGSLPINLNPALVAGASQTCLPQQPKPNETDLIPPTSIAPVVPNVQAITSIAGASCGAPSGVASSQVTNVQALAIPGPASLVTADVIRAQANSTCTAIPNATGSLFVNLKVAGTSVLPDPAPNTVIEIPGVAKVIINEQHPAAAGRGIVVNGVHIIGESPVLRGDIIISHAVSGVVCPNGAGSAPGSLPKPDISFTKNASPSTAKAGDTVTYTAKITNTSGNSCDVLRLIDHLAPVFSYVSTAGQFGTTAETPARSDTGVDIVLRPTALTLAANATATQTFTIKLKDDVGAGTYYNNLELFCNANGDFASGPLAPVTVPAATVVVPKSSPDKLPPVKPLPRTGTSPMLALGAALLIAAGLGARRCATR
ncbi:MAG: DUF11 domain-containing protein [Actinomycetota bacterium]|nr:DUF11 domain-containing protein [Actinomycetota bacterium]